jgi:hypothetical protein
MGAVMTTEAEGDTRAQHDHAWRRLKRHDSGVDDEYRCDVCQLAWGLGLPGSS